MYEPQASKDFFGEYAGNTPFYPNLRIRHPDNPTPEQRAEIGKKVLAAIRALQRSAILKDVASPRINCASGTAKSDARSIFAAIRAKIKAEQASADTRARNERTEQQLIRAYEEAMEGKRK